MRDIAIAVAKRFVFALAFFAILVALAGWLA